MCCGIVIWPPRENVPTELTCRKAKGLNMSIEQIFEINKPYANWARSKEHFKLKEGMLPHYDNTEMSKPIVER